MSLVPCLTSLGTPVQAGPRGGFPSGAYRNFRDGAPESPSPVKISRRESLEIGALSILGLTTADLLALASPTARAKNCILVWLNGGPSHLDTFDLKPDAPAEIRGTFGSIPTSVEGLRICEHLPRIAPIMDRCTLIRSVTSPEGNHDRATHYMLTGWRPSPAVVYPSLGSVVAKEAGAARDLPHYVAVPAEIPYSGSGYLTAAFEPFSVGSDPRRPDYRVRDLEPTVPESRVARRREMLSDLENLSRRLESDAARDSHLAQAYRLLGSREARAAFDLRHEAADVRKRYGFTTIGQSCLLARRLIEAGVRFVAVNDRGWDNHQDIFKVLSTGFPGKLPALDMAFSSLVTDLEERGLLESTLVLLMGDFGRTPKLNSGGGRDHWPRACFVVLAGGGIRRGEVLGSTDGYGELPEDDPVHPEDVVATVYHCLGIDFRKEYRSPLGRPIKILRRGEAISSIVVS